MDNFEREWYQRLLEHNTRIALGKIVPIYDCESVLLNDIYIDLYALTDNKYGIGRYIANSSLVSENDITFVSSLEQKIVDTSNNKMIVVGELGSGKTCLLNHLTASIARYKITQERNDNAFITKFYNHFVVSVKLKDIEKFISGEDCIRNIIEARIGCLVSRALCIKILENLDNYIANGILLLLDGFDEISEEHRKILIDAVNDFCKDRKNTVIITSRSYVYEHSNVDIKDYTSLKVAPFNKDQISRFVNRWVSSFPILYNNTELLKDIKAEKIVKEIFEKQYLMDLASNPLFLTLLLLLYIANMDKQEDNKFPVGRIRLYEEIISLLLKRWNEKIDAEDIETREILEEVAYKDISKNDREESDIYPELCGVINSKFPDQVSEIIKSISEKTGIIINTGKNNYSFAHPSFQEYLAAGYVIGHMDSASFIEKSLQNYLRWKEVDTFIIGKTGLKQYQMAISLLFYFICDDVNKENTISETVLLMVSYALVELLQLNKEMKFNDSKSEKISQRVRRWLKYYMGKETVDYRIRFEFGNLLAILGDDRDGVGVIYKDDLAFPDISWIKIPEGTTSIGADDNPVNLTRNVTLPGYYISKYPITNKQFGLFIDYGGYGNENYWTKEGWNWVQGADIPYLQRSEEGRYPEDREERYRNWLNARTTEHRKTPFWWDEEPWNFSNRPVVGITWYEAVAYCKWLNSLFISNKLFDYLNFPALKYEIVLPSVEEWEKAARGPKNCKYPWGNQLRKKQLKANIDVAKLNQTSTVGIFPEGKSGYGVFDVAGNVYEWIATGVEKTVGGTYKRAHDSNLDKEIERMVKGGAWNFEFARTECASDDWDYPVIFDQNTGFRPIIRCVEE